MKLQQEQTKPLIVISPAFDKHNQGKHELHILESIEEQNQEPLTPDCGCPLEKHRPLDEQPHQDSHLPSVKQISDLSSPEEQLEQDSCHHHKNQQNTYLDHHSEKWNNEDSGLFEDALDKDPLPDVQPLDVEFSLLHLQEENLCDNIDNKTNRVQGSSSQDLHNLNHSYSSKDQYIHVEQKNQGLIDLGNKQNQVQDTQNQDPHFTKDLETEDLSFQDQQNQEPQVSETQQKLDCRPALLGLQSQEPPEHQENQDSPSLLDLPNQEPVPHPPLELQEQDLHTSEKQQTQDCGPSHLDMQNEFSDPPPEHQAKEDYNNSQLHTELPLPLAEDQNSASLQVMSVSDNSTKSPSLTSPTTTPPAVIKAFGDHLQPVPQVPSPDEPKLCGFLQKQGGPLRAWKQRWFTYEEKKNQLFYYRTPQDVMPLGHVDLSSATFTYPLKGEDGTFHIKTPERTFILKVE